MSFLDNLENNLDNLEKTQDAGDSAAREQRTRERDRAEAQASAPYAEQLKNSPYTQELLKQAARVGFAKRVKVHVAWLGSILRLEAREQRLELRPTPAGIKTVYLENNREVRSEPLDMQGSPEQLVSDWLAQAA